MCVVDLVQIGNIQLRKWHRVVSVLFPLLYIMHVDRGHNTSCYLTICEFCLQPITASQFGFSIHGVNACSYKLNIRAYQFKHQLVTCDRSSIHIHSKERHAICSFKIKKAKDTNHRCNDSYSFKHVVRVEALKRKKERKRGYNTPISAHGCVVIHRSAAFLQLVYILKFIILIDSNQPVLLVSNQLASYPKFNLVF